MVKQNDKLQYEEHGRGKIFLNNPNEHLGHDLGVEH